MKQQPTSFDRYLKKRLKDPEFKRHYTEALDEIDKIDELIRALDEARENAGITKTELAGLMDVKPEIVRRLFSAKYVNPTVSTVTKMANALGYRLKLVRKKKFSKAS